ncbi:MAG: M60 family metallopeptidase [Planctomycetaceae bacterium]|nr:M60 family metallopeptidase [Planctomycetaceae bacterium]
MALSLAVSEVAIAAAPPAEVFAGVDTVAMPGVVGSVCVFGKEAFAVATAASDGVQLPFIAGGTCGQGRIVACGHNGYISAKTLEHPSTGKLVSNLMLWAAGVKPQSAGQMKIGVVDDRGLVQALQKAGLAVQPLDGDGWSRSLHGLSLVILSPRKLESRHVEPVLDWVRKGGGLLMADAGWVWEGYNAKPGEVLSRDFAGNRIGRHAGLMWSSRNVESPDDKQAPVASDLPAEVTCHGALERLRGLPPTGGGGAEVKQASATLEATVAILPVDDELLRPDLEALLKDRCPEMTIPRPRAAVPESNFFGRLQVAYETRRVLDTPVDQLQPHPMGDVFPSQPAERAKGVRQAVMVDTARPRWHSTGLYARSGDAVTVTVPKGAAGQGLSVRIGPHKDKLWHKDKWQRAPEITRTFAIAEPTTLAGSGFGGLIYIEVPRDCRLGTIEVTIDGGVPAPLYVHGETTQADWRKARSAPAPWAELASSKFIITLPADAIRNLDRPNDLMDYWDRVLDACADLATIPHERQSPERFVIDAQISAGYMHAGYPIMAPLNLAEEVTDLATLQRKGNWGVYHEVGHNHQQPEWTWDGLGEVTVNLFSIYVLEHINPGAPLHGAIQPDKLARMTAAFDRTGKLDGPFEQLMPYIQLRAAFGWEPFQKVFAEYLALPEAERPKSTQERKDQWLVRFSETVGHDLGPFYASWKIGMSPEAMQKVRHLPAWMPEKFR